MESEPFSSLPELPSIRANNRHSDEHAAGAEIALVLQLPGEEVWAIKIKPGLKLKLVKGFHHAREDLQPQRAFVVYSGEERYPRGEGVEVIGLTGLGSLLQTTAVLHQWTVTVHLHQTTQLHRLGAPPV